MSRLAEFVIKRDFGKEIASFSKTLVKLSNHKVIGRSKGYGDVRLTMNGAGAISKLKIDKSLKGNLEFMAIGALEAINDARHKIHSVKRFEWNKYANSNMDVPEFMSEYYNTPGSRALEEHFAALPNRDEEELNRIEPSMEENMLSSPDVDPLAPYFYDQPIVDQTQKLFEFFETKGVDFDFFMENMERAEEVLIDKDIDPDQFADELVNTPEVSGHLREWALRHGSNWKNEGGVWQSLSSWVVPADQLGSKPLHVKHPRDPWFTLGTGGVNDEEYRFHTQEQVDRRLGYLPHYQQKLKQLSEEGSIEGFEPDIYDEDIEEEAAEAAKQDQYEKEIEEIGEDLGFVPDGPGVVDAEEVELQKAAAAISLAEKQQ